MSTFTVLYDVLLNVVSVRGKSPVGNVLSLSTMINEGNFLVENLGIYNFQFDTVELFQSINILLFEVYKKKKVKIDVVSAKINIYTQEKLYNTTGH